MGNRIINRSAKSSGVTKTLDQLLQQWQHEGENMDSFEADHLNAQLMSKGITPVASRAALVTLGNPAQIAPNTKSIKAQFDIRILRNSANIADSLEVGIFGDIHFSGGYIGTVFPTIGGTVTVTGGTNVGLPDRVRFTHVNGVNTDTVDIFCNQIPYPTFLTSMSNAMFKLSNIRYSLSNAAQTVQFSEPFEFRTKSMYGKGETNPITVLAFKKPEQFQAGIVDLPINADMSREDLVALKVNEATTDEFTLSCFLEHFYKQDRRDMAASNYSL